MDNAMAVEVLRFEITRLKVALLKYGVHHQHCACVTLLKSHQALRQRCDCGLEVARTYVVNDAIEGNGNG